MDLQTEAITEKTRTGGKLHFAVFSNIDIVKYTAALCVIWVHLSYVLQIGNSFFVATLTHTAVPFFFVCSGLLMGWHARADGDFSTYFRHKCLLFFRLWIIWLVIYIPLDIVTELQGDYSLNSITRWILLTIGAGQGFCSWPLWYLFSSFIGCFIVSILCRKRQVLGAVIIFISAAVVFVFVNKFSDILFGLFDIESKTYEYYFVFAAGRYLVGSIYISAGILLSYLPFDKFSDWALCAAATVLITIGCLMADYNIMLNELPRSIGVVVLAICLPQIKIDTLQIRQQSMWIYFIHMYWIGCLQLLKLESQHVLFALLSYTLSIVSGYVLSKLVRHRHFTFLRKLIC